MRPLVFDIFLLFCACDLELAVKYAVDADKVEMNKGIILP
ncbi:hypothetical protein DGWBC_1356 [Dehalogenimonas sp. WBC-2]|nr:hypothetical protein DGWBC_1356 [Dehalogenimonas sp. WBC-2]